MLTLGSTVMFCHIYCVFWQFDQWSDLLLANNINYSYTIHVMFVKKYYVTYNTNHNPSYGSFCVIYRKIIRISSCRIYVWYMKTMFNRHSKLWESFTESISQSIKETLDVIEFMWRLQSRYFTLDNQVMCTIV